MTLTSLFKSIRHQKPVKRFLHFDKRGYCVLQSVDDGPLLISRQEWFKLGKYRMFNGFYFQYVVIRSNNWHVTHIPVSPEKEAEVLEEWFGDETRPHTVCTRHGDALFAEPE